MGNLSNDADTSADSGRLSLSPTHSYNFNIKMIMFEKMSKNNLNFIKKEENISPPRPDVRKTLPERSSSPRYFRPAFRTVNCNKHLKK
jgi:hypothetical protein